MCFVSSSTVITGLVEFAHRTNDKSNITAFESLKLGPWYEMENISDINLKHEQYEEHLIVLCVKGSSGLGNSRNHTCLLMLISMLWHRQAIFESKGDKLSSSAESRIRTHQELRHQIASRLNAHWKTDWAIEDQAKNLNSTARPYDQRAFSPLDPTAVWLSHLALAIYMFVDINFDALAQASDIRIERRQVVFLCWEQDLNPSGSQTPNRQQTECPLTNRLSYRGSSIRTWLWRYTCLLTLLFKWQLNQYSRIQDGIRWPY